MTAKATKPRPKQSAIRFSEEDHAMLDWLAESYSPGPDMTVTRTAVLKVAIRELYERRRRPT